MINIHDFVGNQTGDILWWQMSLRAVLVFAFGLLLVRLAGKRVFGKWSAMDIILSVIIGSNLSRALTGSAPFTDTLVATALLVGLHGALASAAVRIDWLGPWLKGNAVRLASDGEFDERVLRKHGIGPRDLEEALRAAGAEDVKQVRAAWLERSGQITIARR